MKILNLVLYSDSKNLECYDKMKEISQIYYKQFPNVTTIYYKFSHIKDDYTLKDNILHIKGYKESYVPGVLYKTIRAFEYFRNNNLLNDIDYVVRSNISTIINFDLLMKELEKTPIKFYGGGNIMNLQWNGGGITDSKWYGTNFASGTSIILTKEAFNFLLDNKDFIRYDIIDDVAIGIFFREHKSDIVCQELDPSKYMKIPFCFINNTTLDLGMLKKSIKKDEAIFYRHCCFMNNGNRTIDAIQMQYTVNILMNNIE